MNTPSSDSPARASRTPLGPEAAGGLLCAAIVLVMSCAYLGGTGWLFGTPIMFEGDGTYFHAYAKGVLQSGWNWDSPRMGAPFGFPLIAYPSNLTYETAIMSVLRLTTDDPVTLLNRTWAACLCLSGLGGYLAFRILGTHRWLALSLGALFATIPYAFYRNIGHFNLEYSAVALPLAAATLGGSGALGRISRRSFAVLMLACVTLGLGYVYNAFFVCFLLAALIGIGLLTGLDRSSVRRMALCLSLILGATALNLLPSFISWAEHGRPDNMDYKNIAEADIYALRIRDLLLPDEHSPLAPLARLGWNSAVVPWPNSNENLTAKVGSVAAVGFLLGLLTLCGISPRRNDEGEPARRTGALLLLLLLLLALPGGFGSIFNLLVTSDIRAYNRVAPLIAWASLFLFGSWLQAVVSRRLKSGLPLLLLAVPVLVFGFFDQNVSQRWRADAGRNRADADALRHFVAEVERTIPARSSLLMLPLTTFPPDQQRDRMHAYDHAKPGLFSRELNWSWPQFSLRHTAWLGAMGTSTQADFYARAFHSGFTHIWLDTFGLGAEAAAVQQALTQAGATHVLSDPGSRYAVFQLSPPPVPAPEFLTTPVTIDFKSGFHAEERTAAGEPFRWAGPKAVIVLRNLSAQPRNLNFVFSLQGLNAEERTLVIDDGARQHRIVFNQVGKSVSLPVSFAGSGHVTLRFHTDAPRSALRTIKDLRFTVIAPQLR